MVHLPLQSPPITPSIIRSSSTPIHTALQQKQNRKVQRRDRQKAREREKKREKRDDDVLRLGNDFLTHTHITHTTHTTQVSHTHSAHPPAPPTSTSQTPQAPSTGDGKEGRREKGVPEFRSKAAALPPSIPYLQQEGASCDRRNDVKIEFSTASINNYRLASPPPLLDSQSQSRPQSQSQATQISDVQVQTLLSFFIS